MAYALGIDVSRWQGSIDWSLVATAGYKFAAIRCTVGNYYYDPNFERNWNEARAAGLLVTAYHVPTPDLSAASQVIWFQDHFGARVPDLPLVIDMELDRGQTPETVTDCYLTHVNAFASYHAQPPLCYTNQSFGNSYLLNNGGAELFVANYTSADQPAMPIHWRTWRFWQHSNKGAVPGITENVCDLDRFNGELSDLLDYAGIGDPDPEPPTPGGEPVDLQPVVDAIDRLTVQTKESFEDLYATLYDLLENGGGVTPPPDPDPTTLVRVIRDPHANGFYVTGYNSVPPDKGGPFPIMGIYGEVGERIQWDMGTLVAVDPEPVRADGGAYFWRIDPSEYAGGLPQLYFHPSDVAEV